MNNLALLVIFSIFTAQMLNAESFLPPPNSEVSTVTENSIVKGMKLNIRKFNTESTTLNVLKHYQNRWGAKATVTRMPPWDMIGFSDGAKFYNVQVQQSFTGSWGYLSISDLPKQMQTNVGNLTKLNDFPAMGGSRFIDSQQHTDALNTSITHMLSNSFSVEGNSKYYITYYLQRGWRLLNDSKNTIPKARVLLLAKGDKSINFTLRRTGQKTEVIANMLTGEILGG